MNNDVLLHLPPSFIMLLGSVFIALTKRYFRLAVIMVLPALTLWQVWNISNQGNISELQFSLGQFAFFPLHMHPYSLIFASGFCVAAFAAGIFAVGQSRASEIVAGFISAGSAIGVCYAGDFITLLLYLEIISISSVIVIFSSKDPFAGKSAVRYAIMHFLAGIFLMAGIIGQISLSGSSEIVSFNAEMEILFPLYALDMNGVINWLMLLGLLILAAAPPFSAWLADSYSKASISGSVFLSAFTTKSAIFILLTVFAGSKLLVFIGLFMVFYGMVYAIMQSDMRRMLSYSIINQLGVMLVGIGIGKGDALNGVATIAFCSIIYNALLFMSAGSVIYATRKNRISDVGGLYRPMKITAICGIIAAFSCAAFPLTCGFVSKFIIISSASHEGLYGVWFLLLASSAGVVLHAGLKFPWLVFFGKDSQMRPKDPPLNMCLAMIFLALLCIIPAIPNFTQSTLYRMLPTGVSYIAYTPEHVITNIQLLLFSASAFFIMLPILKPKPSITLDFDWIYRGFLRYIILAGFMVLQVPTQFGRILLKKLLRALQYRMAYVHGPKSSIVKGWSIGTTVLWTIFLLGIYLVMYYVSPLNK
jgi:multicomponent Na+:H+ antiporter subunit D